jgi:hypothetical protein
LVILQDLDIQEEEIKITQSTNCRGNKIMNHKLNKAIALLIFCLFFAGCETPTPMEPVETSKVVMAPGTTKGDLYDKLRQWFSENFVSGESVIDYEDKEAGALIGNAFGTYGSDPFGLISHSMKYQIRVDVKEGRFRVESKILTHRNTNTGGDGATYDVRNVSGKRRIKAENYLNDIVLNVEAYVLNKKSLDF